MRDRPLLRATARFLFRGASACLPAELQEWRGAMLAEIDFVGGAMATLRWAVGSCFAIQRLRAARWAKAIHPDASAPLAVRIIALYQIAFAVELIGTIAWQIPKIREPWADAIFPVLFCVLIAIFPAVLALGLWTLDDSARIGSMLFALCHALMNVGWISQLSQDPGPVVRVRILIDVAVIVTLLTPSIRKAFRPERLTLRLDAQ
ncbi:MAG TPA: hypothetical protein VFQ00_13355 [Terriglobales bacterium]|nr:hypothetical protein [Terriglobales bacterium]